MSRKNPAPPCACGFTAKNGSKSGMATHGRVCPVERAGSAAFVKAVEDGRGSEAWADRRAAEQATIRATR